jgi:hypothetical protein
MDWGMASSALEALVEFLLVWFGFRFILTFGSSSSTVHTHTHALFVYFIPFSLSPCPVAFALDFLFDFFLSSYTLLFSAFQYLL